MNETGKFRTRAQREGWWDKYLIGKGIDIGCGADPVTPDCDRWDKEQGDAQVMKGIEVETYNWVFSSHCLEHLYNPQEALLHWWRILKPAGYLIVLVPDEDLYEQGIWPSFYNPDHKRSFTLSKNVSWSPISVNLIELIARLPGHKLISARIIDTGYDYDKSAESQLRRGVKALQLDDQTQSGAELSIEVIVQRSPNQPPRLEIQNVS